MKRRSFLRAFGVTAAAATIAPAVLSSVIPQEPTIIKDSYPVGKSDADNIVWMRVGDNYMWYRQSELDKLEKIHNQIDMKLYEKIIQGLPS